MVRLAFESGLGLGALLGALVVAVGLCAWFYRRVRGVVPDGRWWLLVSLRAAVVGLVLLLLFRPVLSFERNQVDRKHLVLLLDRSRSMATADGGSGQSRFDQARAKVLTWARGLGRDFTLHLGSFADGYRAVETAEGLGEARAEGEATSLVRALVGAAQAAPRSETEAVIVFSDGIHNAAGDPAATARQLGLVVHTIGVGNSLKETPSYRDVRIAGLDVPEQMPVNNQAKIAVRVGHVGLGGRVVKLTLLEDDKVVTSRDVELPEQVAPTEVILDHRPTQKGRHAYTARIDRLNDERIEANNERTALAQVIDARIRVLYIEGALRAEYGAIVQRYLSKDPDVEFLALVQTRPGVFTQRANLAEPKLTALPDSAEVLDKFDVIVLGDLDAASWKPGQLDRVGERVRGGAGLLMIGGYRSLGPGGYAATPLASFLPVELGSRDIGQVTEAFVPVLTPEGQAHLIFTGIGDFFPTAAGPAKVEGLPPLDGCTRVAGARPGASVLATLPGDASGMPVLAVQPAGQGRAAVFTADTTRNWQQVPRALERESPFTRFWGQLVRWLANRNEPLKKGPYIEARLDRAGYEPDAPIGIEAVVRDAQGEGSDRARVVARFSGGPGGDETIELAAVAGSLGSYRGSLGARPPGNYRAQVEAALGDQTLRADELAAEVGRPNLEFDRLDLDDQTLGRIAEASGGQYRHLSVADRLIEELDRSRQRRKVAREIPLAQPWSYWTLVVGLLAAEWIVRRRLQLR